MLVVQLLLPLFDNAGQRFPDTVMRDIRQDLVSRFGGVTAFSRMPAEGVWSDHGRNVRDEVILVEVMVDDLDQTWWRHFRMQLQDRLRQKSIVVRAFAIERL